MTGPTRRISSELDNLIRAVQTEKKIPYTDASALIANQARVQEEIGQQILDMVSIGIFKDERRDKKR